jgi:iduronate 2-sulfatase
MPTFEDLPANSPRVAHKRGGEIANYAPVPGGPVAPFPDDLKRQLVHGYYASTSYVDAQVGKVVAALDELGLADETVIVFWGDHGFHLGDHGIWTKHTNYEQANRIPLLIAAPGVAQPGTSTRQPAGSVDLFPTLAELAGLPAPAGPQPIDGLSLVPVLRDPAARVRDHTFHAYPKAKLGRAVRTDRHRLVEWKPPGASPSETEYELYDYTTDPLETRSHAGEQPEALDRLKAILATYPEAVQARSSRRRG